jgi:hypothetical protein
MKDFFYSEKERGFGIEFTFLIQKACEIQNEVLSELDNLVKKTNRESLNLMQI